MGSFCSRNLSQFAMNVQGPIKAPITISTSYSQGFGVPFKLPTKHVLRVFPKKSVTQHSAVLH